MSATQFEVDIRECDREANRVAALEPGHRAMPYQGGVRPLGQGALAPERQIEHERAYAACMVGRGYTERR